MAIFAWRSDHHLGMPCLTESARRGGNPTSRERLSGHCGVLVASNALVRCRRNKSCTSAKGTGRRARDDLTRELRIRVELCNGRHTAFATQGYRG
jgi:hypothetical protein